ncbi:hypothetical protein [Yoonia sp.]|uniref:hypothetical protein n=1 Tax=Yoonia sp. TaxID=2212373 RepID=UPI0032650100
MTRYDSAAWAKKANKRKAYRDHVRDSFFKKTQAVKHAEPQDMVGSPASQSEKVADLLKLTAKGSGIDADQKDAIATALAAMKVVSLGTGTMGTSAKTEAVLRSFSMKNLRDNWFWSPSFFD